MYFVLFYHVFSVRKELLDVLELPYKHSEYFPPNAPRRLGILLYGPPGKHES
jgi:SpoVK/Ycf46/Vps4 family AAA+-type ATPase